MPFATLGLPPVIVKGVRASGHMEPTLIQRKAIPVVLQGNDLIGAAKAGTGKTAAYLLPMLTRLLDGPRRLRGLVLAPTRELAAKVETQARDYARFTDIRIVVVYPGAPLAPQEKTLQDTGVDLLVTTPSRLLELHGRGALNFEDVEMMVLDEADRMERGLVVERVIGFQPGERCGTILTAAPLENTRWVLASLGDSAVAVERNTPWLTLQPNGRAVGSGGCNRFSGPCERTGDQSLRFGALAATRMACPRLDLEQAFLDALERTRGYVVVGRSLELVGEGGAPLARLEAAEGKPSR